MDYRFGPFVYDSRQKVLTRDDAPVALTPKTTDLLHALIERRGTLVEKAELMRLVWPDATVEESGLARNISLLRKALEDENEEYIETVPRRGYRFKGAVAVEPARRWIPAAAWAGIVLAAFFLIRWQFFTPGRYVPANNGRARVAVLPLASIGGTAADVFAKSLNERLAAELARVPTVELLSPSTVERYRQTNVSPAIMTRVLAMDVVLEGSVSEALGDVRVTARLADVHTGTVLWGASYQASAGSLERQDEIARTVAAEVAKSLRH